ncbi:uncharacterized protein LOC121567418 isoform X2 [Coregonus clupeaformis]|uniref:uncharacterized protein LOC121567418 isoform X2 n=1 Tax=Coregonus clupeaformis TaxID=59861 RepID=UPI001BDFB819|nr:uncharacterized protein LOC121567418 isoform X2 [Coregonus clupeaformis]
MIQQNNNNNYPCLEISGSPREVLQKCQKSNLPFTRRLELGDMPLVKGFRAWAACSKNRRRAAPPPRSQGTCLRPADVYPVGQWGRLGYGLGLPLDSNYASNPRQTGLGALVTVATLKASEGGGQTQTRCLFLNTEGGRCLYSTGSPRPCTQGLVPQSPSTLVGSWLRDKVGGVRDSSTVGKMEMQDMGGASGSYQVKSRSTRRWRTSCKPVVPIQGRTLRSREDAGEHTLEGSQESRAKGEFPTTGQNTQSGKQNRGSTRSPKCSHAQTKTCTQCHRQRGGQGSSGGQREAASVYEQDQPSCGMEGIKEEEEEKVQDGTGLTWSKPCDSCQPPDHADPENCSSDVGDWGKPDSPHAQEGLHPETSLNKEHFQDKLWDKDIHTGGKDVASGIMRCVEDFDGMVGAVIGFVDHIKSAERDSERLGGTRGIAEGELPNRWIDVQSSERHCCSERGCLKACSTQPPSPAGGSISTATDETGYGQTNQETKSDSQYNKLCEKCLPEEKDPAAVDKEGLQKPVHGLCEKEGEEGIQSTEPENRELCGEHGEELPEVRSTDDEARLVGGDITSQRTERGLHWATEEHESEEMEERCFSDLPATLTEEAVGGWREAGTGQLNSLLRGSADAGPATTVTHSPPNPASSGAMATGLPAPNAGQTDAGGGALVPLLLSPEEQEWKRGLDENKVAANGGFLDGGPEAEGEDDFGLFMQAEEQPLWDDSFTASPLVPSGKSESVGWTDSSFQQSEDAWTAFPKDTAGEGEDKREQWWPTNAVEETRGRFSAKQNVNNVFVEAFPSLSTPPYDRDAVPTLSQLLRGILDHESSAEDHGLLDGFHDLNKMFGLKYKKANAVSRERLLRSLRLGQCNTENMTGERAANYSPSLGLPSSSQHAQACGKRRLSYVNKNIME